MDLSYLLRVARSKFPERVALVCVEVQATYAELDERGRRARG
jgi:non-ribosomal peptide synthetase component F